MNMGGRFLGNSPGQAYASTSEDGGGNGVLSEVVRPQLRGLLSMFYSLQFAGVSSYQASGYDQSNYLNEYGGGPLGSSSGGSGRGVQSAQRSAIDRILNTFLGSSFSGGGGESSTNLFSSSYGTDYGSDSSRFGSSGSGSNIEALLGALSASGAKPARVEPESQSLLGQLFGR